jgi:hypothetical protein
VRFGVKATAQAPRASQALELRYKRDRRNRVDFFETCRGLIRHAERVRYLQREHLGEPCGESRDVHCAPIIAVVKERSKAKVVFEVGGVGELQNVAGSGKRQRRRDVIASDALLVRVADAASTFSCWRAS